MEGGGNNCLQIYQHTIQLAKIQVDVYVLNASKEIFKSCSLEKWNHFSKQELSLSLSKGTESPELLETTLVSNYPGLSQRKQQLAVVPALTCLAAKQRGRVGHQVILPPFCTIRIWQMGWCSQYLLLLMSQQNQLWQRVAFSLKNNVLYVSFTSLIALFCFSTGPFNSSCFSYLLQPRKI